MHFSLKSHFQKYGANITVLYNSLTYTGKAFITPLRYRNRVYLGDTFEQLGQYDSGRYLFIGTPDIRLDQMDETAVIIYGGENYLVKRAELFCDGDKPLYMWAVLFKSKGGDSYEQNWG